MFTPRTVPIELVPELLEIWDATAHHTVNPQNRPLTFGARLKRTSRLFIAAHPGRMFGQGNVYMDLYHLLDHSLNVANRLS